MTRRGGLIRLVCPRDVHEVGVRRVHIGVAVRVHLACEYEFNLRLARVDQRDCVMVLDHKAAVN